MYDCNKDKFDTVLTCIVAYAIRTTIRVTHVNEHNSSMDELKDASPLSRRIHIRTHASKRSFHFPLSTVF